MMMNDDEYYLENKNIFFRIYISYDSCRSEATESLVRLFNNGDFSLELMVTCISVSAIIISFKKLVLSTMKKAGGHIQKKDKEISSCHENKQADDIVVDV